MKISQPSPVLAFPGTQVHSAVAPVAFTDLDLSAVVGARRALVCLRFVKDATAGADNIYVRENGHAGVTGTSGVNMCICDASQYQAVLVTTDAAGIIEWRSPDVVPVWTVTVEAYIAI